MKDRLDVVLYKKGYFASREKAKAAIMAGVVFIDGQRYDKAGTQVDYDTEFTVKNNTCPYVSRGGLKLEKAIKLYDIDLKDKTCIDMGASTGGFTDCMLKNGAKKVYSIDVGYGQLDYSLRIDDRVVNMEKTNIRYMTEEDLDEKADFVSIDVSFISLKHMLGVASLLTNTQMQLVALIKPQFEAGREQVGKKGIVRDKNVHMEVIINVLGYAEKNGLFMKGLSYSPITGTKGNIEYLAIFDKTKSSFTIEDVKKVVDEAHEKL
ncbi:MAG: TlyA family RNA methyltransferase [Eubacteriales bacterium]|nr:TlyA family RNA methyltransferase [Eubacteriales bacterium]MDY3333221.1 TlyA family RNA methyltransferase [Gallibacter sp.]